MESSYENPFSVTKATEFSDKEISEYWVDFTVNGAEEYLFNLLQPKELQAKYILGSKGCGKTHLLRYYSYPLQKIRANNDVFNIIKNDSYFGIYAVFGGLNSSRFSGKGIASDQWEAIFEFYLELYLSSKLLETTIDIFECINIEKETEQKIVKAIITKLSISSEQAREAKTISEVLSVINEYKRKIDFEVNNSAFTRKLNFEAIAICFSSGDLLFGIPEILQKNTPILKNVKIIYILDELEKLSLYQKIYINTLIWDKKYPCTFWIGARYYGYTTRKTKVSEELRLGSEYEVISLDEIMRNDEKAYAEFATKLVINRLKKDGCKERNINEYFEEITENEILNSISKQYQDKELPSIVHLKKKLIAAQSANKLQLSSDQSIAQILGAMYDENPLIQKYKTYYLYQLLSRRNSLANAVSTVQNEYANWISKEESKFNNIEDKYKGDLLAQLLVETKNSRYLYRGIQDFIKISWGNPRSFLIILKKMYQWSTFFNEKPFQPESKISIQAQNKGVFEASLWFYQDAEVTGEQGKYLYTSIKNLAEFMEGIRFSDKPSEISLSSFSINNSKISKEALDTIDLAVSHSFLIDLKGGRVDKNMNIVDSSFQINRMLAPRWNLPIFRRGVRPLQKDEAEAIFDHNKHEVFKEVYKNTISSMTVLDFNAANDGGIFFQPNEA